jgi:hypothetical protein
MHFIVPADYAFGPHAVQRPVFTPASPAIMSNDERLYIDYEYMTDHSEDVLIFSWPAYDDQISSLGVYSSGSTQHPPPSGVGDYWLYKATEDYLASSMYLFMRNLDQSETFFGHYYDGWWAWGHSSYVTPAPDHVPTAGSQLGAVYPNPFNPVATIPVNLPKQTHVDLAVYDLKGRLVQSLHRGSLPAGRHQFTFKGDQEPSGVYFTRMKTPTGVQTRSMMLVK